MADSFSGGKSIPWGDYAHAYDSVISHSTIYRQLLDHILGYNGPLRAIPDGSNVLDCGAGPGLLVQLLSGTTPDCRIVAVENNPVMMEIFTDRCPVARLSPSDAKLRGFGHEFEDHYSSDGERATIKLISPDLNRFDAEALPVGTPPFDAVFLINVLYALDDPVEFLRNLWKILATDGELRLIGPRVDSNTVALLEALKMDLEVQGEFDQLRNDYATVFNFNMQTLSPIAKRWAMEDVLDFIRQSGFSRISHTSNHLYAGQAMCIVAIK